MVRVLVVDDNGDAADTWVQLLGFLGYEAKAAYDGQSALRTAAEFKPRVILLDIGLPDSDGFEVAQQLRNDPTLADVHLVAVSGFASPRAKELALKAGCHEFLLKPVKSDVLREILAGVMSLK